MRALLLVPMALLALAGCGTWIQVVDAEGAPVAGADVALGYHSLTDSRKVTDAEGYVRLRDSWLSRPMFWTPVWVYVTTTEGSWCIDYPPPAVLQLDASHGSFQRREPR